MGKRLWKKTVGRETNVWYLIEIGVGEYNSYKLETENKEAHGAAICINLWKVCYPKTVICYPRSLKVRQTFRLL